MKKLAAAALLFSVACATTDDAPEPVLVPVPSASAADPRIGEMQTQLTELLERIDVLNHRIAQLEEVRVAAPPPASAPARSAPEARTAEARTAEAAPAREIGTAVPQAALVGAKIAGDYRNAIVLYGQNKLSEARRAFQQVFEADPQGDLADNALFWIGETYFAAKDYVNAVRFYMRVTTDYADENKAPDALFKTALAQERTGDLALARRTLQQVIDRYPYSSPASTAKQELQRIKY
jgi:tol-pal system protein YbgF